MDLDCRVDPSALDDELDLPVLTWERVSWAAPTADVEVVRSLTRGQWAMLVLETVQGQVDNGGFFQFFDNSGEYLGEIVAAARLVGAGRYVSVLERAVALWPGGLPADIEERRDVLDERAGEPSEEVLAALDSDFYAIGGEGLDLLDHVMAYVREHPAEFFLSPEEAQRDVDGFIARLRSHVGTRPGASDEAIAGVEAEIGRALPDLLRRLYREVGDGGWGPERGMLRTDDLLGELSRLRARRGPAGQDWPTGTVPLGLGDEGVVCADLDSAPLELGLVEADQSPWSSFADEPILPYVASSLRGWLEEWMRGAASLRP